MELLNMSSSEDTDDSLIDNSNHIITSIQEHETRIHREEEKTKQLKEHIEHLEEELVGQRKTEDIFIHLFTIKTFSSSTTRHLLRLQDGLYELLKNKLSPKLVTISNIERALTRLKTVTSNRRYKMALQNPSDVFMCDTSFVAIQNGSLIILVHIPIYKEFNLMKLLEYKPTPITLTNKTEQQVYIKPESKIIAVNEDMTLYTSYSTEEIHHYCKNIHEKFYCSNRNIMQRTSSGNCLLSLYLKKKEEIKSKCTLQVKQREEKIYQLNSTSFYTYTPTLTTLFVNCEKGKQEKYEIEAYNIIQLKPGCKASINKHIFSSGIEIEQATNIKQTNIKLHLKEILDITEDEEEDFIKLLEEEQTIGTKPVTIIDVKKKYDLHILSKKNHFITKLFGAISTIITIVILIFIGKYI